jgi:hypothetical protein
LPKRLNAVALAASFVDIAINPGFSDYGLKRAAREREWAIKAGRAAFFSQGGSRTSNKRPPSAFFRNAFTHHGGRASPTR